MKRITQAILIFAMISSIIIGVSLFLFSSKIIPTKHGERTVLQEEQGGDSSSGNEERAHIDERNRATPTPVASTAEHVPTPPAERPTQVMIDVPFTTQAPLKHWENPTFQDGCEEASILMAELWLSGAGPMNTEDAERRITEIAEFTKAQFGHSQDTSAEDTAELARALVNRDNITVITDVTLDDIRGQLANGSIVLAPTNGRILGNPHFTSPGPLTHMVVIIGYDDDTETFTTNDPGTQFGAGYMYPYTTLMDAISDYPTGHHLPIDSVHKNIIVVSKRR